MLVLYTVFVIAVIALDYYIAKQFESVASDKGYEERKYFHLCFWLGMVGYLLVIALPDQGVKQAKTNTTEMGNGQHHPSPAAVCHDESRDIDYESVCVPYPVKPAENMWVCKSCGTQNKKEYGQCKKCGNHRSS